MADGMKAAKPRVRHPDRITLLPAHLEKIDAWIKQATTRHRGVRLGRNDIIAWLIDAHAAELSLKEEQGLSERHYDEERFLKEALLEIRARKARGETYSLGDLLQERAAQAAPNRKPPKARQQSVRVSMPRNMRPSLTPGNNPAKNADLESADEATSIPGD